MSPHIIVHYHLRAGGVTRVIEATSRALSRANIPHLILCGSAPNVDPNLPVRILPELDYSLESRRSIKRDLLDIVHGHFGRQGFVWHFHNPCLGKNPSLTRTASELATDEAALILQHHDFAEDGRPENYSHIKNLPLLYPTAPRVIHACINHRDQSALVSAGLDEAQSHVLPNPISVESIHRRSPRWIFQPVRGIRRKNLGETLLLAAHAPDQTRFAISRRPEQEEWLGIHDHWAKIATELGLPVEFAVTDRLAPAKEASSSFASWLEHSSHLLTTSVAEGFGLTFLEGAALKIPVIGRRLPELDPDLQSLPLEQLYSRLLIPSDMIDMDHLHAARSKAMRRLSEAYALPKFDHPSTDKDSHVDFARLPEEIQETVIRSGPNPRILVERDKRRIPLRDHLTQLLSTSDSPALPLDRFQPDHLVSELIDLRNLALSAPIKPLGELDRVELLKQFNSPSRFHFLTQ